MSGSDTPANDLRPLIARVTGSIAAADIRGGDRLVEDLGMDSLEIADLLVAIEEQFEVVISADTLAGARTVAELEATLSRLQCVTG
ncbi:acyl carrier protein [Stenotrophomonas sp. SORGH_AS_0321]|uniref:acyl carrier protein n=1 Tax=Stenotrophomonas sp. SORGH_AS_0321 TaxID=3041787 RepID=UPI002857A76C|nr:acyl carrier protein [Stenotrophomonas sp. SORGH_AS_0321]MDR6092757.1 acyl carrier protein [Stenotrophomonas sp. SORGH_AS_0321]